MSFATKQLIHAVAGILKRNEKILLAERPAGKPYSGYWEFPGGKIEEQELGENALKRELHEELGIEVVRAQFCFEHIHPYPDKTVVLEIWLVDEFMGEPHSKENQILRWVTFSDMQTMNLLEGNWALLNKIEHLLG